MTCDVLALIYPNRPDIVAADAGFQTGSIGAVKPRVPKCAKSAHADRCTPIVGSKTVVLQG